MKRIDNFELIESAARCGVGLESNLAHPIFSILSIPAGIVSGLIPNAVDYSIKHPENVERISNYIEAFY